jgi:transcriptional regulator with XRE-family HTH domain
MTVNPLLNQIHSKKLGLLLKDARLNSGKTLKQCADAMGVTNHRFQSFESGILTPSLPELEAFAFFIGIKISHFFGDQFISDEINQDELPTTVDQFKALRQRVIGTHLKLSRIQAGKTLKALSLVTGISSSRLKKFEQGEASIPLFDMLLISDELKIPRSELFVQSGKVGKWRKQQEMMDQIGMLSEDIQLFISQPVNRPYIELAMNLSKLSADKLRAVAEGLLEITY